MSTISIIIPTYNSIATIDGCLKSIVSQVYDDYEVIIMDGKSTDGTIDFIKDLSNKYKNIKIYSEKDKGIYDAMNKGIDYAHSDWIYFLGSDDYLFDDKVLSDVAEILKNSSSDLVYGDPVVTSSGLRKGGEFSLHRLLTEINLCHQTVFYRRTVFNLLGGYNLAYPIIADWDFNIRCFQNPTITTEYIDRIIVLFNDVTGVSSISRDDHFYKMVPATYIQELEILNAEKKFLLQTAEYKIGKRIYTILKKLGIVNIINKVH